jgi:MbtH protein
MDTVNPTLVAETPAPHITASSNTEYVNPFDDTDHLFHLLLNDKQQHSLWPAFAAIPAGWQSILGPVQREACVDYLAQLPPL